MRLIALLCPLARLLPTVPGALTSLAVPWIAGDRGLAAEPASYETTAGGREAFAQPFTGLPPEAREQFGEGRRLFRQAWVIAPSLDDPETQGLGPLYNQLSCIACHVICGRPRLASGFFDGLNDLAACGHMSGLFARRDFRWP